MRIGMVVINSAIGGTEKRFSNLFRLLSANTSDDYHLFVPDLLYRKLVSNGLLNASTSGISRLYRDGLKAVYPLNPIHLGEFKVRGLAKLLKPFWRAELKQAIKRVQPDVLHIALPTDHLRPLPEMPFVVELANNTGDHLNTWLVRRAVRRNCLFNCATEGIRKKLIEAFAEIDTSPKARVIPCSFMDYSKVQFAPDKPRQKKIVFIGRFEEFKNPFLFLRVIEVLAQRRKDFQVQILGAGSLEKNMRKWISEHNLNGIIHIAYTNNPLEVLSDALVYFSAYQVDNYHSQALLEAMASGCAIVASDIGETRKVVDERCGFLVSSEPNEMAEKIDFLLDHVEIAKEMGQQARQKVMREQTFERYASHLTSIYYEVYDLWHSRTSMN